MGEGHPGSVAFYRDAFQKWAGIRQVFSVIFRQCPQGETVTDVMFILRMNVGNVVDEIGDDGGVAILMQESDLVELGHAADEDLLEGPVPFAGGILL